MIRLKDVERSTGLLRLATPGAMAYAAVFPLVQVALIAESAGSWPGGGYRDGGWALLATVAFLPLLLHHVRHAAHGSRAPYGAWTLAALTAIVSLGALPLSDLWLPTYHVVAVSALLVLRPRAALPVVAAVVAAQVPLALLFDSHVPAAPAYYAATVAWRAAAVFVPIWLIGAVTATRRARQALADEAVVRERVRIDAELRDNLGRGLSDIATRGERAVGLVDHGEAPLEALDPLQAELHALVGGSRQTLARARQMINGYQQASLAAEVGTAATLLRAAGIETRVVAPAAGLPVVVDDAVRTTLRADVVRLLRDDAARACVITVTVTVTDTDTASDRAVQVEVSAP